MSARIESRVIPALFAAVFAAVLAASASADENVSKQVHLIEDGPRLVASNVLTSRFDELKLDAREQVADKSVGEAVLVVVTNRRVLAYGARSGWREMNLKPNEEAIELSAEDYAGLVVTDERFLNFNGRTGAWAEQERKPPR